MSSLTHKKWKLSGMGEWDELGINSDLNLKARSIVYVILEKIYHNYSQSQFAHLQNGSFCKNEREYMQST